MTNRSSMAACVVLLVLGACAKSEVPLPNKNTNWLDRCKVDADCGDELECRCGMCTVTCESDSACELDEQQALCWQEQSDELADQCGDRASARAICVPEELTVVAQPVDDPCAEPGSCELTIAEGLQLPKALAVDDERIYWLEGSVTEQDGFFEFGVGTLESVRHDGTDPMTYVTEILPRESVGVDGSHVYFVHDAFRSGGPFLSRVPLGGGEAQRVYEGADMSGFVLSASTAYFLSMSRYRGNATNYGIHAVPTDGSLYTNPLYIPEAAELIVDGIQDDSWVTPGSLLKIGNAFYWEGGGAIYRFDTELDSAPIVLLPRDDQVGFSVLGGQLAHQGGTLVWTWIEIWEDGRAGASGIGRLELADPQDVRRVEVPGQWPWIIAMDATDIYAVQQEPSGDVQIVRIDLATLQVTPVRTLENAGNVLIALSDDHVFVASGNYDPPANGSIIRFAKGQR